MLEDRDRPYRLSEILVDEFEAIAHPSLPPVSDGDGGMLGLREAVEMMAVQLKQAALHDGESEDRAAEIAEAGCRQWMYQHAHALKPSALCLSGGGIRSASVSLGVIQALADKNLLRRFNYLSTVSGGGYIGSWLSAWLCHTRDADVVVGALQQRRDNPDREPPPISHLRRYSNYLTPKLGVFSADTWTAVAIVLRNLVVNWLILIPAIALPVILVKFLCTALMRPDSVETGFGFLLSVCGCLSRWFGLDALTTRPDKAVAALCLFFGWLALGYKLHRLYAPPAVRDTQLSQNRFIVWSLVPAILGGFCFVWLLLQNETPADALGYAFHLPGIDASTATDAPKEQPQTPPFGPMLEFAGAVFVGAVIVAMIDRRLSSRRANRVARRQPPGAAAPARRKLSALDILFNGLAWLGGVLTFALVIWAGRRFVGVPSEPVTLIKGLCVQVSPECVTPVVKAAVPVMVGRRILIAIFGMPWFLLATMSAHTAYLLLRSASGNGDVEREWLGRASGWHFIAGLSWMLLSAIVLLGPNLYYSANVIEENAGAWLTSLTAASGAVTAFLGKSQSTPAKGSASGVIGVSFNIALAAAGTIFAALLLILISLVLDWPIAGSGKTCFVAGTGAAACAANGWAVSFIVVLAFVGIIDGFANVNRFSIHALYRNRLVRAFLGGARAPNRSPDGFTDFDWHDNLRMAALWDDQRRVDQAGNWRPFHVVNMTLNLAATTNLAWQERKASSFTVTPRSCGNPDLGYRPTQVYGGPVAGVSEHEGKTGITLGTAMAISGAAVSPNMGYNSSPSLSFLLTLFNVRLGWWLGNPRSKAFFPHTRPPYRREGPLFALRPLLSELFGLTSADSAYVYLSDGGHFEDLGLYEMVRRRCKWIVICDDDQDGKRGFADLGNAVRKIWIDLGVRITFPDAPLLQAGTEAKPADIPYFAIGKIDYVSDNPRPEPGKLLYIKPAVRGDEDAADVIAYQRANPDFPAQTTGDQWFDESQLEAYRRLGYLMTYRMLGSVIGDAAAPSFEQVFTRLQELDPKTMRPRGGATGEGP